MSDRATVKISKGGIVNTRYIGPNEALADKSCMARETDVPATVDVRFNDPITGMSTGWHPMPRRDLAYWASQV